MANAKQLEILNQGSEIWNKWLDENLHIEIDLEEANLVDANLATADLRSASLIKADLRQANLSKTDLWQADFSGANLENADLSEADLTQADLRGANLTGTKLVGSKLSMARVNNTIFGNLDLSEVIGLANVDHKGPSHISTDTFVRSKGKIPESFLRGCGLSDWEISSAKLYTPYLNNSEINDLLYKVYDSRAGHALQISPLFISYSHADNEFVDKIGDTLNEKGVRYWRDVHDMKAGPIEKQIDRAIEHNPTVLLVLSKNSLKSDWVEHEVRKARQLQKKLKRDVLCPVTVDKSWKRKSNPWPERIMEQITEYNILDFSAWKDNGKFYDVFQKLIDGLELFYKG